MTDLDAFELLFGGMGKLGPGSDDETRRVLAMLPPGRRGLVVDVGCGTGRQTLVLARELDTVVHAVDFSEVFLADLARRAEAAGLGDRIQAHHADMTALGDLFREIDLIWSEGAAYSIGFAHALASWRGLVGPSGCLVASELTWLRDDPPAATRAYFEEAYPVMQTVAGNTELAELAGWRVHATHTLSASAWTEGFYDELGPRARRLLDHEDPEVAALARGMLTEIDMFHHGEGSYGYVFFVLVPA